MSGMGLTPRQRDALSFIERRIRETGKAPTYRQIVEGLGVHSTSGVSKLIHALVERGRLRWSWGQLEIVATLRQNELRVVYGPGHFEDLARLNRARYAQEGA